MRKNIFRLATAVNPKDFAKLNFRVTFRRGRMIIFATFVSFFTLLAKTKEKKNSWWRFFFSLSLNLIFQPHYSTKLNVTSRALFAPHPQKSADSKLNRIWHGWAERKCHQSFCFATHLHTHKTHYDMLRSGSAPGKSYLNCHRTLCDKFFHYASGKTFEQNKKWFPLFRWSASDGAKFKYLSLSPHTQESHKRGKSESKSWSLSHFVCSWI